MLHHFGRLDRQCDRQVLGRVKRMPIALADKLFDQLPQFVDRRGVVGHGSSPGPLRLCLADQRRPRAQSVAFREMH